MPTRKKSDAAFNAYALAAGRVVYAWNELHENLVLLFSLILGAESHLAKSLAVQVWFSVDSDRPQQGMLRAAIEGSPPDRWSHRPNARSDLLWLLNETRSLADHRNLAIHAPAVLYVEGHKTGQPEMGPAFLRGNPRAGRLVGKRLLEEFGWYYEWAETLCRFALEIETALNDAQRPWPKRPCRPTRRPAN